MIRIILIDDHAIIRDGIRSLLREEPGLEVVGEASSGQELLNTLATTPCDVVVLDLNMPGTDGFTTIPLLRERHPEVRILVLSMLDNERYVVQAIGLGASGYALKSTSRAELVYAINTVAAGQPYLCTVIGLALLQKLHSLKSPGSATAKAASGLSKRELEVLTLIAEGLTNAEIADKLFTSKRTIETHRQNIIEKTQAKNTAALIKFAVSQGMLAD
ncbi:two component transcriptional regulator, LuxR family [Hymenobacter roseosalivarius DSM 11622]|uniref:Two component transcriptional regulator, LuxR family n=1 Tax=Hymenobacter roseosalivarius DSM 11622 TaxID=645990 RepID=A0A1W1VQ71_9BACT|nr:response regulator transcription factor [Hymenobacter roseosalivarius]SMB95231.1 two component transcriptional regulator, LuxR family [Hymenobacter roseosalivarius DSM 11622]